MLKYINNNKYAHRKTMGSEASGNPEAVAAMAAATGISPVLANLLVQRGIDTLEKAKKFFNPSFRTCTTRS